jgi:hypothetical protein
MIKLNFRKKCEYKNTEKGMALVESIPVLFTIVIVFNFSLGFFGSIHSGILNSIGAYNYSLETFRFRSNLMYFRPGADSKQHYLKSKNRVHGVIQDGNVTTESKGRWPVTVRKLAFNAEVPVSQDPNHSWAAKASGIWSVDTLKARSDVETPEIWIKTVYGICINAECQ